MTCTAKLLRLLCFFFFCGKGCISTNYSRGKSEDSTNTACQVPYHPVGDYCLLIDNDIRGTWREMEEVCQALGGNLANLQDANILYEINKYIISNGMNNISYWVGATDEAEEGEWTWSSDNTTVKRGAPLWGHLFGQQPDGGEDQNCGVLHVNNFYYMHDDVCSQNTYGVICQPSKSSLISASGDLRPKGDADINTKFNESNIDCPYSYEIVGNACLQVFPELSYTWTEAKDLCNDPYTHLAKIDDANQLGAIYDYLTQKHINAHVWIGGTDEASENEWVWHDATPIKRGTPFWNVNGVGSQEPVGGSSQNCAFIWDGSSYFFCDLSCTSKRGALCQFDL